MIEILVGLIGGLLIGATGIGAGSLIAPLLVVVGYSPATAVGAGLVSLVLSSSLLARGTGLVVGYLGCTLLLSRS